MGKLIGSYPVIIPPSPGVLCALGDATTLLRHEVGKAFARTLGRTHVDDVLEGFEELYAEVKRVMHLDQGVVEEKQVRARI